MARIVIAHQSVFGPDQIYDAYIIAQALVTRGHDVFYIADDDSGVRQLAGGDARFETRQVKLPPGVVTKSTTTSSSHARGLSDKLAEIGFADLARLRALMNAWIRQLRRAEPDVIVAAAAPVAWFVGPIIAPTLTTGSGSALPVSADNAFIQLANDTLSTVEPATLKSNLSSVLAELGLQPIASLINILGRCQEWHYGLDYFDPYLPHRRSPSIGILGDVRQDSVGPAPRLSIFLDTHYPNIANVLLAIAEIGGIKADLFIKGATRAMQNFFSGQTGITLWDRFETAVAQVPKAGAIVHHGAPMLATVGVAAGRPHLVLPWTNEQMAILETLKKLGVAWWKDTNCPVVETGETLHGVLNEQSILNCALHHGRQLAEEGVDNALLTINAAIEAAASKRFSPEALRQVGFRHG